MSQKEADHSPSIDEPQPETTIEPHLGIGSLSIWRGLLEERQVDRIDTSVLQLYETLWYGAIWISLTNGHWKKKSNTLSRSKADAGRGGSGWARGGGGAWSPHCYLTLHWTLSASLERTLTPSPGPSCWGS